MHPTFRSIALASCLIAGAASAAEVNVYSSRQPELIDPILAQFTEETGIEVNVVFIRDGLIERLKAEGRRSPADIVLTVDIANLSAIVEAGVTQPVQSDVIEANIPAQYRDEDGNWFGLTSRSRILYVSKDRVPAGAVSTYEQLADLEWTGRICMRSGLHNYNVALTAAYLVHHGEQATVDWLTAVKGNLARKPQGNDRAQVKAIWAGECDVAVGNTYYMGQMLDDEEQREWAESVNIVFATLGGEGAHVNLSGMAMTASAPHPEEAAKLMEFLTSQSAQELYAELNYEYPLLNGASASERVQSWGEFTADPTPLTDIAAKRSEAVRLIERVDFDG